jgi:sugar transferase (PEP-CTERM system associated)
LVVRIFRHYVPISLLLLEAAEAVILVLAVYAGVSLHTGEDIISRKLMVDPVLPKAGVFAMVLMLMMTATGLYRRDMRDTQWGVAARVGVSFAVGAAAMTVVFYLLPGMFIGRGAFALSLVVGLLGIAVSRSVFYAMTDYEILKRRMLVVGSGAEAAAIEGLRRRTDRRGITVVGYAHFGYEPDAVRPEKILPVASSLLDMVRRYQIDELVIAVDDRAEGFPVEQIIECKMSGVQVIDLVTFFERQVGRVKIDALQPTRMILLDGFSQAVLRSYSKRLSDLVASVVGLVLAAPVMLVAALAIYIESGGRGPIFYRQERVGRNGRVFQIIKFRSMRVDAEKLGVPQFAARNDPRVTAVGRFIRKTRIDELPQLFNVLKDEMSFVGPRPERPQFVEALSRKIPYYALRHRVNPGITGWAQISYPYGATEQDARAKLEYDLYYIKNYSLFLDLTIIFQTIQVILWGEGAR